MFFPAKPRPAVEIPNVIPPLVVVVGDSIIKVLVPVKWPLSLRVHVKPRGGEEFVASLSRAAAFARDCHPNVIVLHSGINDLSRGPIDASKEILRVFTTHGAPLRKMYPQCAFVLSSICQTRNPFLNVRVAATNRALAALCDDHGWVFSSNDAIQQFDLRDEIHLTNSGSVKLQRRISFSVRCICKCAISSI
jgi:hypothetical protein